ncbi:MAG: conserved membrane protein of unknown function [Candidatus Thorarchaeota archaeon]|nr:MAG: conserved membrane protein of unknown function [Candidatus Thorarchaeota archaeon]
MDNGNGYRLTLLTAIIGLLYIVVGTIQEILFVIQYPVFGIPLDPIQALLLLVVGAVYLTGINHMRIKLEEGYAFVLVGSILAGLIFILQIIVIGTNALGWFLQLEDWSGWTIWQDITPSIWLFPFAMVLLIYAKTFDPLKTRHKEET